MATRVIERPEPTAEESAWTKWWAKNKPQQRDADVIKIVDHLSVDERVALSELRRLGEAGELDAKATTFEELAKAARGRANARRMIDTYPHLFPPAEGAEPSRWPIIAVALNVVVMAMLIALGVAFSKRERPTLTTEGAHEAASAAALEATKAVPRSKKGGGVP